MKIILSVLLGLSFVTSGIYSISVVKANGNTISLSEFEGKKILIVNIATSSERVSQLIKLQDLQEEYEDSLVVIVFPSNSFGKESRSNAEIILFCQNNYGSSFQIASKGDVIGSNKQSLYQWLTNSTQNSVTSQEVKGDFQKYLISASGELIGVFSGSAEPDHPGLIQAIEN